MILCGSAISVPVLRHLLTCCIAMHDMLVSAYQVLSCDSLWQCYMFSVVTSLADVLYCHP